MTDLEFYDEVWKTIKRFQPKAKLRLKENMWQHRLITKVFKKYADFSTTTGWTVAIAADHVGKWDVLGHEGRHVMQAKRQTRLVHSFLYAFPQILGVLGVVLPVALWNPWYLLSLLFVLPFPAFFRMSKELEAYSDSVTFRQWRHGHVSERVVEYFVENFSGPNYWFMWPFKKHIRRKLKDAIELARTRPLRRDDPYLTAIYLEMEKHDMVHQKGIERVYEQ